jgi:predicted enzyme related to lactoylglutathione lyase
MARPEKDRRIDYVEIGVRDVAEAKVFYGRAFGWEFTDYGDEYAAFDDRSGIGGGLRLEPEPRTNGGPLVILYALDLEATEAGVRAAGGRIVEPIFTFPGGRRFHFADSSGNVLAVWSDPAGE